MAFVKAATSRLDAERTRPASALENGVGPGDRKYAGQVETHTPLGGEHNSLTGPGRASSDLEAVLVGKTSLDG